MSPPKRFQSHSERDHQGLAARKEREREAAPIEIDEECTGRYEGEELAERRAKRPTEERVAKIEIKYDNLDSKVDAIHGEVREMRGELKVLPRLVDALEAAAKAATSRDHVAFTASVEVGKAEKLDTIDARKARREMWIKIAGAVAGGLSLGQILHAMGVL